MTARFAGIILLLPALLALAACANFARDEALPIVPITYRLPEYRNPKSVGNLRRLLVLPVDVSLRGGTPEAAPAASHAVATTIAAALRDRKGYDAFVATDVGGQWRAEIVRSPELGDAPTLARLWREAKDEASIEAAARRIGRAVQADGLVVVWTEVDQRELDGLAYGAENMLLLWTPFFYELFHTTMRIAIRETASGRAVWRASGTPGGVGPEKARLLENLENAIPEALTH